MKFTTDFTQNSQSTRLQSTRRSVSQNAQNYRAFTFIGSKFHWNSPRALLHSLILKRCKTTGLSPSLAPNSIGIRLAHYSTASYSKGAKLQGFHLHWLQIPLEFASRTTPQPHTQKV